MPYVPELGMRVFDPREAAQEGMQAGQMFAQAYQGAQNRALNARGLDLDERKLKMLEEETHRKAQQQLHRQVGMASFQADTQALIQAGHDENEARKTAFMKWSPLIFEGIDRGGEMVDKLMQADEIAAYKRERDTQMYDLRRMMYENKDQLASLTGQLNLYKTYATIQEQAAAGAERQRHNQETEGLTRQQHLFTQLQNANKDEGLKQVNFKLGKAQAELAGLAGPQRHWYGTKMDQKEIDAAKAETQKKIDALLSQRAEHLKRYGLTPEQFDQGGDTSTPAARPGLNLGSDPGGEINLQPRQQAAPAQEAPQMPAQKGSDVKLGTLVHQGGKAWRYQGGDVNDPKSWIEEKQ